MIRNKHSSVACHDSHAENGRWYLPIESAGESAPEDVDWTSSSWSFSEREDEDTYGLGEVITTLKCTYLIFICQSTILQENSHTCVVKFRMISCLFSVRMNVLKTNSKLSRDTQTVDINIVFNRLLFIFIRNGNFQLDSRLENGGTMVKEIIFMRDDVGKKITRRKQRPDTFFSHPIVSIDFVLIDLV